MWNVPNMFRAKPSRRRANKRQTPRHGRQQENMRKITRSIISVNCLNLIRCRGQLVILSGLKTSPAFSRSPSFYHFMFRVEATRRRAWERKSLTESTFLSRMPCPGSFSRLNFTSSPSLLLNRSCPICSGCFVHAQFHQLSIHDEFWTVGKNVRILLNTIQ